MAYRRRRRRKFTWFPTHGTDINRTGQTQYVATPLVLQYTYDPGVDIALTVAPLVLPDFPVEETDAGDTLVDFIGNEYVVERIVGNAFGSCFLTGTLTGEFPGASLCSLGIFVARANGNNPDVPAGWDTASPSITSRNFNPLDLQTIREPWMFRRTWVLSHRYGENAAAFSSGVEVIDERQAATRWPQTTAGYFGRDSNHFVDVKSVRRIRQDERLWVCLTSMPYPLMYGGATPTGAWGVRTQFTFDYRVLGALRRAKNKSNF